MTGRCRRISYALPMVLAVAVSACATATPVASFDPASACTTDGRMPGAYPELEAVLPKTFEGAAPATVDSGRNCTKGALGSLADAGIDGVEFAGATWPLGGSTGLTVAVFEADGLEPAEMVDFYAKGAVAATKTDKAQLSDTTVAGQPAKRLDVLASDGSGSTIVAWPGGAPGQVMVLLAADLGDAKVLDALEAVGGS